MSSLRTLQKGGGALERISNWAESVPTANVPAGDRVAFLLLSIASPPTTLCPVFPRGVYQPLSILALALCLLAVALSSAIVPCQISLSGPSVAVETIANPPPIFSSSSRLSRRLVLPSPSVPLIARVGARRTFAYCSGGYGNISLTNSTITNQSIRIIKPPNAGINGNIITTNINTMW